MLAHNRLIAILRKIQCRIITAKSICDVGLELRRQKLHGTPASQAATDDIVARILRDIVDLGLGKTMPSRDEGAHAGGEAWAVIIVGDNTPVAP